MKRRPAHATDCPGCNIGWVFGDLLCPRCTDKVNTAQPSFYPQWLKSRAALHSPSEMVPAPPPGPDGWAALEAYHRGLIVGTAIVLHRPKGNGQHWEYRITPKGRAILDGKQPPARA